MALSESRRRSHCACWTAAIGSMYSASHVDNTLIDCFAELQLMDAPLKKNWTIPLMDLRSFVSPAWSTTECVTRPLGGVLACWEEMVKLVWELSGRLGIYMPVDCVARRWRAKRLRNAQCRFVCVVIALASLLVTRWISGLVRSAM